MAGKKREIFFYYHTNVASKEIAVKKPAINFLKNHKDVANKKIA